MEQKRLLTVVEAAALLGITRSRLYGLIALGPDAQGIVSIKLGKARRIPVWALDAWVANEVVRQGQKLPVGAHQVAG